MTSFLFVDDEPSLLTAIRRLLRREPVQASFCDNPVDAIELLATNHFDVVVSDFMMPQMTGARFLRSVREHLPSARRLLLTGYADARAVTELIAEGTAHRVLEKPFEGILLIESLRAAALSGPAPLSPA